MEGPDRRRQFIRSFEAKSLRSRSFLTQVADILTAISGSTAFLLLHVMIFASWIAINVGLVPEIPPFDPFPFGLLTMSVSLEAIFLSIFVLVSQNRSSHINTIRDEVHLGLNLIAEEEITKILKLLAEMRQHMGITKKDVELAQMLEHTDTGKLEKLIIEQLERANKPIVQQMLKEFPDLLVYPITKPLEIIETITNNDSQR